MVRCVAGEGSGGTYLGWALTHRWGGYGSRNCVGRRRRNGEVGEGEGGGIKKLKVKRRWGKRACSSISYGCN